MIFDRDPATGALTQKPGTDGCFSDDGTAGHCRKGRLLDGAAQVAASPDGKSVYVTSPDFNAVTIFDRDPATGALSEKPGTSGCVSESGTMGACADGTALKAPFAIAVSPDGKSVYATSLGSKAVTIFDRDPTTGSLSQKAGAAGCISEGGTGGACRKSVGLDDSGGSVAISPDGKSVYVTSFFANAVAIFRRDPGTGALTQRPGPAGCISESRRKGACGRGRGLRGAEGVAVSPDGKSVYVSAAFGSVAIFDRNPATSALRQKPGVAGCIASTPRYRQRNRCRRGGPLGGSYQVAVSADGRNVYVTSAGSDGLAVFRRNPATGVLSQARGIGHCISEEGRRIGCRGARALEDAIDVALSPDGRNVYVTGFGSDAVAVLDRTR